MCVTDVVEFVDVSSDMEYKDANDMDESVVSTESEVSISDGAGSLTVINEVLLEAWSFLLSTVDDEITLLYVEDESSTVFIEVVLED
jgi:hypothetical protein